MSYDFSVIVWGKNKLRRTKLGIQYLRLVDSSADMLIFPFIGFIIKNLFCLSL